MSEFKFACPVCGQHVKVESWKSNTMMECPTCFQKIIVPQAPADDTELIIKGSQATRRQVAKPETVFKPSTPPAAPPKSSSLPAIAFVVLLCAAAAAWFVFRSNTSNQVPNVPNVPKAGTPVQAERRHGAIGLGSWNTQVEYTNVVVTKGTQTLYRSNFIPGAPDWRIANGRWIATNNVFIQTAITPECHALTGDTAWSDYTLTLQARKLGGYEGFDIMFNVLDDQNWTWWNLGGWNNTKDAIEYSVGGVKSLLDYQIPGKIDTGRWYDIRIELEGAHVRCYLDGAIVHDFIYPTLMPPQTSLPASLPPAI